MEQNKQYHFLCKHCGEYDIIPGGIKTHKCSHCGYRNKVSYEDAIPLSDEEISQSRPSFVLVNCPYCGAQNIVANRVHTYKCTFCQQPFSVLYEDENPLIQSPMDDVSDRTTQEQKDQNGKVIFSVILIVAVIIFCICSLCSSPDESNTPLTDKYETTVVVGVKNYLRNTLRDPDSYQDIEWSQIGENAAGSLYVRHKYRAKNGFGGYVVENKIFYLDKQGNVVGSENYYGQ